MASSSSIALRDAPVSIIAQTLAAPIPTKTRIPASIGTVKSIRSGSSVRVPPASKCWPCLRIRLSFPPYVCASGMSARESYGVSQDLRFSAVKRRSFIGQAGSLSSLSPQAIRFLLGSQALFISLP